MVCINKVHIGLLFLMYIFFLTSIIPQAIANPITFTDITCLNTKLTACSTSLTLYYPNGTVAGTLKGTADTIDVDPTQPLNVFLKPSSISLFNNPAIMLDWVLNSFQALMVIVFVFAIPIATFYIIRRLFVGKDPVANTNKGWGQWKSRTR